ncbi:MerR family transcriptional regulator [Sutterella sp.]|uniref:MerR family transcriptional regulator n=1 Tax=Sutterella sp. TaxID=1981025 RepID=UPI0026E005A7|nr:MerR family transcriptional regulator [Sutterella sp.]MDO5530974.1 MerR family transcriptional regulator [Sutterella sp.]
MRIRDLAQLTGNTPETIRYYEKIGLLPPPRREANNYRQYGEIHVSRLDFIRHCRNLDIGLVEIRSLLGALDEGSREGADLAHKLIHQHLSLVDARIKDLNELRRHLKDLEAHCRGEKCGAESCGILAELNTRPADKVPDQTPRSAEEILRAVSEAQRRAEDAAAQRKKEPF